MRRLRSRVKSQAQMTGMTGRHEAAGRDRDKTNSRPRHKLIASTGTTLYITGDRMENAQQFFHMLQKHKSVKLPRFFLCVHAQLYAFLFYFICVRRRYRTSNLRSAGCHKCAVKRGAEKQQ